jgi:aminocarboxymuconate-semialdehyde decarboxylase
VTGAVAVAGLIDWHNHMLAPGLQPPAEASGKWPGIRSSSCGYQLTLGGSFYRDVDTRTFQAEPRLAEMDDLGVQLQVLSAPPYAVAFDGPGAEYAVLVAQQNEFLAEMVAAYPDRFALLAMLPYGDDAAVSAELKRLAGYPGVAGVCLTPNRDDHLCQPEHRDLWRTLAAAGHIVFVHPADTAMCEADLASGSVFGAGMPFSTARIATRLITSGTLSEVSELRVLLAHAGGALAATIDRLTRGWQMGQLPQLAESPLAIARRAFWVDAIAYAPAPLRAALDTFGPGRMVYGSDYPFAALLSPHELASLEPTALELVTINGKMLLEETTGQRI